jgi:hypothetical protein
MENTPSEFVASQEMGSTEGCSADQSLTTSVEMQTVEQNLQGLGLDIGLEANSEHEKINISSKLYQPLDPSHSEIRLITILPDKNDDAIVSCFLETVALSDDLKFAAISYLWGDPKLTKDIFVNGILIKVTENLEAGLRHIRKLNLLRFDGNSGCIHLWADAISINQDNVDEKNFQLSLMAQIYQSAKQVICWLGLPGELRVDLALKVIKSFVQPMPSNMRNRAWKLEDEEISTLRTLGLKWLTEQPGLWTNDSIGIGLGVYVNHIWRAIWIFKTLKFWERVWILQELALPNQTTEHVCLCGEEMIQLVDVALFFHFLSFLPKSSFTSPELEPSTWAALCLSPLFKNLRFSNLSLLKKRPLIFSPFEFIYVANHSSATDPRDLVYGLLGLANIDIRPDYKKSTREVYIDWFSLLIRIMSQYPDIFVDQGLPISAAGVGLQDCNDLSWPSWLPDLSRFSTAISVTDQRPVFHQTYACNTLLGLGVQEAELSTDSVLSIWGVICANISELWQRPDKDRDLDDDLKDVCFEIAFKEELQNHPKGLPPIQALFRTIYQNEDHDADTVLFSPMDPKSKLTQWFRVKVISLARNEELLAMETVQRAGISTQSDLFQYLDQQFRGAEDPTSAQTWAHHLMLWNQSPSFTLDLATFNKSWNANKSTIFYTNDGYIGCGPHGMLPSDQVCILHRCSLPVVLRKTETGWILVGTCYVYGLSDGEPVDMIKSGKLKLEEFKIH